jgi:hypothetical protein
MKRSRSRVLGSWTVGLVAVVLLVLLVRPRSAAERSVSQRKADIAAAKSATPAPPGAIHEDTRSGDLRRDQIAEGGKIYLTRCKRCHDSMERTEPFLNVISPMITAHALTWHASGRELWQYVTLYMPFDNPGTLTNDEYYAVLAFLLDINGLLPPKVALDADIIDRLDFDPFHATATLSAPRDRAASDTRDAGDLRRH